MKLFTYEKQDEALGRDFEMECIMKSALAGSREYRLSPTGVKRVAVRSPERLVKQGIAPT